MSFKFLYSYFEIHFFRLGLKSDCMSFGETIYHEFWKVIRLTYDYAFKIVLESNLNSHVLMCSGLMVSLNVIMSSCRISKWSVVYRLFLCLIVIYVYI